MNVVSFMNGESKFAYFGRSWFTAAVKPEGSLSKTVYVVFNGHGETF
jgi:hypothetical protein